MIKNDDYEALKNAVGKMVPDKFTFTPSPDVTSIYKLPDSVSHGNCIQVMKFLESLSDEQINSLTYEQLELCQSKYDSAMYYGRQGSITAQKYAERGANKVVKFNQALDNHPDAKRIAEQRAAQQAKVDEENRQRKAEERAKEERKKEVARKGNIVLLGIFIAYPIVLYSILAAAYQAFDDYTPVLPALAVMLGPSLGFMVIAGVIGETFDSNPVYALIGTPIATIAAYYILNPAGMDIGMIIFVGIGSFVLGGIGMFIGMAIGRSFKSGKS